MKYACFLLFALLFIACEPSSDQKKEPETTTPSTPIPATSSADKRTALLDHLAEYIPNWQAMPPQFWLPTQYITDYNANLPAADRISYDENTLVFGDFNGDQREDAVGLLINRKSEVWLMALFGKEGGYDVEPIFPQNEGVFKQCCLGVGLKTLPPGEYNDIDSGNKVQVKYDGIEYSVYEKVSFLTFLENGKFRTIRLGD